MFKRFSVDEHMSTSSKVKSSQQRSIRAKVLEQYPDLEPYAEMFMPKKAPMVVAKCRNKNKGVAIEMVHFLGDDLWTCSHID
ncbi:Malignant T-cell-amplified sequence 1 [Phytophthora nicotianae]|uniref:Malignant T-cell-amplified sequence 1 n=1 Tax=Phytophthora nicotianae TaxID=4792 RepID=A0A0W8C5Z0_PHYNI|nr:Malignant T-cell-amplified sequence 1 [Phytophthora nicotianae]